MFPRGSPPVRIRQNRHRTLCTDTRKWRISSSQVTRSTQGPVLFPLSTLSVPALACHLPDRTPPQIRSPCDRQTSRSPQCPTQGQSGTLLHRQGLDERIPRKEDREKARRYRRYQGEYTRTARMSIQLHHRAAQGDRDRRWSGTLRYPQRHRE